MDFALFHKHKRTYDVNNPYDNFIKYAARHTHVPKELLTRKVYYGKSSLWTKSEQHHFFDKTLFPQNGTPVIMVSRDKHRELQSMIGSAKSLTDYALYEFALKDECHELTEFVTAIYQDRISQLRLGICGWIAYKVMSLFNPIKSWLINRRRRKVKSAKARRKYLRRKAKKRKNASVI